MARILKTEELVPLIKNIDKAHADSGDPPLLWYLGTVYTQHPQGLQSAYIHAKMAGATLAKEKIIIYSPIAHWHEISLLAEMPTTDHDLWMSIDQIMIDRCDGMILTCSTNWEKSRGLKYEREAFGAQYKPVFYWDPELPV